MRSDSVPNMVGYITVQTAILFATYGLEYSMPWWVTWFPSIAAAIVIVVAFVFVIIAALAGAL